METKKCSVCQKEQNVEEFRRMTGLKNKFNKICRSCIGPIKQRNDVEKEHIRVQQKLYREKHKEALNQYKVKWRQENRELVNKAAGERFNSLYQTDPAFKARALSRAKLRGLLSKAFEFELFFGCSFDKFRDHIESLWEPGMTWQNYGREKGYWNIDHILPLDGVNDTDKNHYTNLQPMWLEDNARKGNK